MASEKKIVVSCPTCHKEITWDSGNKYRPFCNERCKLIDLGEWAAEEKRIPGDPLHPDQELDFDPFYNNEN